MSSLNKVFLMGNLTRDPELRYATSGTAIVGFGMAINQKWKSQDGEAKEETTFVDVSMFGKRAETINEYFSKGNPIFIEGRLRFEQWETKEGQKRNALKVVATDFQFIGASGEKKEDDEKGFDKPDVAPENIPF